MLFSVFYCIFMLIRIGDISILQNLNFRMDFYKDLEELRRFGLLFCSENHDDMYCGEFPLVPL